MRAFFDSNIAVYRFSVDFDPRRPIAERLFEEHDVAGSLVVSTQVLLETYNTLVRKKGVSPNLALASIQLLARYEVVSPSQRAAMDAAELAAQHHLSVWDAFIIQAALEAGCDTLFSEDLQAGRRFGALQVVNPFDLAAHESMAAYLPSPKPRRKPSGAKAREA